jgi:hypothetical protein
MDERPEDGQELLRQIITHLEAALVLADKGGLLLAGARIADVLDTVRNSSKPHA